MPIASCVSTVPTRTVEPEFVSIIVCTFNRADMLDAALVSLKSQQTSEKVEFEIVVVDDGSTDSTDRVVAAQQDNSPVPLRYTRQEHAGVAAARNRGIKKASGDWIAFFDDDQIAERNWLIQLIEKARAEDADCVGGPSLLKLPVDCDRKPDRTIRRLLGEEPMLRQEGIFLDSGLDPRRHEATIGTGNALVKRSLFEQAGLFSESLVCGEDREFFKRAKKIGARFANAPSAVIYHVIPSERLSAKYLLRQAASGGQALAEIDDYKYVLWHAFLRLGHLLVVNIPRLCGGFLLGNQTGVLGRKCSIRFSLTYITVALRRTKGECLTFKRTDGNCHP